MLLVLATLCASNAFAYDFEQGGIYYNFTDDNTNTVEVTYRDGNYNSYSGTVFIPGSVLYAGTTYSVIGIGNSAFRDCESLYSVILPENMTYIRTHAFYNCSNMTAINIPKRMTSIASSSSAYSAFAGCDGLRSLVWNARNCSTRGYMPTANIETVTIGDEVSLLPENFLDGSKVTEVVIPSSVTSIGAYAFRNCKGLTEVVIPDGVTEITTSLFNGCTGLTSVTLPSGVTSIGNSAFLGCSALPTLAIPSGVTSIGGYAFEGCTSLDGIVIPEGVTDLKVHAFYGCSSLTAINIPAGMTSIASNSSAYSAFAGCDGLRSLIWNARNCSDRGYMPTANIETVTIGDEVSLLPGDFVKGSKITEVNIPASVDSIGKNAFLNCDSLIAVTSRALIPPTMAAQNCFSCYETATLTVSVYAKRDYESTDWWNLFTNTVGEDFDCFEGDSLYYKIISDSEVCVTYRDTTLNSYSGDIRIPSKTIIDGVVYDVTAIGDSAFCKCTELTSVRMPYSIKSIDSFAFGWCKQLNNVIIPDSVKTIGRLAFYGCYSLANIDLSNSLISIGGQAFEQCCINELNLPSSLQQIGISAFTACPIERVFIPKSVTSISLNPFEVCRKLTEIVVEEGNPIYDSRNGCNAIINTATNTIVSGCINTTFPEDVNCIGYAAFYWLNFEEIIIPNTITKIEGEAFRGNDKAKSLVIPNSVTYIGNSAFEYLWELQSIFIPNSVIHIGISAFASTADVTSIEVEEGNPNYDSRENCNAIIETGTNTLLQGCQNTVIPQSITTIGKSAFRDQENLLKIDIPNSVESILYRAFEHCCDMVEITIGSGLRWIERDAFERCYALRSITCKAVVPPAIEDSTCFDGDQVVFDLATLYVPIGSVDAYRADVN